MGTEIFRESYEGGWEKIIVQRSDGTSTDAYVNHASAGKKFRSGNDLLKYVQDNPRVLQNMDPHEVNFCKTPGKNSAAVKKFIEAIEKLKNADPDEVHKMAGDILEAKASKAPKVPGEKREKKPKDPSKPRNKESKGPTDFKCSICKKSFERSLVGKIRMKKHMKKRHDVDPSSASYSDFKKSMSNSSNEPSELKCEKCGKRWKNSSDNRQRLRFHMKKRHDIILPRGKDDEPNAPPKTDVKKLSRPEGPGKPRPDLGVMKPLSKPGPKSKTQGDRPKHSGSSSYTFKAEKERKEKEEEEEEEEKPTVFKNPFFKTADNDSDSDEDEDKNEKKEKDKSPKEPVTFVNPFFKNGGGDDNEKKKEEKNDPEKSPEFHWSESDDDDDKKEEKNDKKKEEKNDPEKSPAFHWSDSD